MKYLSYSLIVPFILTLAGCEEFCEESNRTAMVAGFYTLGAHSPVTRNNVSVRGMDNDSALYAKASLSVALCPLNPGADVTVYIFTEDAGADTVTIEYTRHTGFISSECGCINLADITGVRYTTNIIREIAVVHPGVGKVSYRNNVVNAENIRIYY
ncbi:MAG: hypothetical protein LBR08_07890 [Bacteroidales bacterium]|jgi:hypothetical protein|nr:hypothetical protein [Bacteroidales bacterium]